MQNAVPTPYLYAFAAMTGMLVLLLGVLAASLWRFSVAARDAKNQATEERSEGAFVASALQEALAKLRTQERALQERAEASERLSETIVSGLASGLLLVDASKRLRIVNPAGCRLLGLPDVPPDAVYTDALAQSEPLARVIEECLLTATPITRRLVTVVVPGRGNRNGNAAADVERHLGVTVSPLSRPDGTSQGVICLFTDLTKIVALEEQLRLKDSLALLGELTAGLAHELRNGLATVHGYVRLLDPTTLPAPQAGYVTALREETAALNQLVTNFLNFARPVSLTPVAVDVSGVVSRVRDEFAAEAARLGGTLSVGGRFGRVDGDEVLLRQVFSNLCRNAIEACEGHGDVPRVRVEGQVDPVSASQVVRVSDNGPGIDPLRIDRIFQPFFTTKSTGTGLGLAVAQKIVVTHNGRVTASNGSEGGAVFEVRLPLSESALGAPVPRQLA
jgi:signal transduction histidine kinase